MNTAPALQVLDPIPFDLDAAKLRQALRIDPGTDDDRQFAELEAHTLAHGRPKAVFREAFVTQRDNETVSLNGIRFSSRMLARNLATVERVFVMVATCGREMDDCDPTDGDLVAAFWWDALKAQLHQAAVRTLTQHLKQRYRLGRTASMQPGSGDATVWPIAQQRVLFELLGDVEGAIGVRLTESCLMIPNKTTSGILFPTAVDFESCTVCRRTDCPSRQAPLDDALWQALQHNS